MQIVKYDIQGNILRVGFKEDKFVVYVDIAYNPALTKQELLQKAYIQVKSSIDYEKTLTEHSITTEETGEEFIPEVSKPIKLEIDFNSLKGKVLDQYGNIITEEITFSIEGTDKAKIENNKIVEQSVLADTDYFIVAKYGDLFEKHKRTIYVTKPVQPQINQEAIMAFEAIAGLDERVSNLERAVIK